MSRLMAAACLVVGLGLAGGFGSIAVDSLLDARAFPAAPTPVTVAALAAMTSVPRGTWVSVVDGRADCSRGYAKPQDTSYVLVGDETTPFRVIAALNAAPPCERLTRKELTGVPSLRRTVESVPGTDVPHGLAWQGVDWRAWPQHRAVILWTASGPDNSRMGVWLGGGFALLGVWLTWYGVRWLRRRAGDTIAVAPAEFPSTVQLRRGTASNLPATVVWLPVLRAEAVSARGIATDVTIYHLGLPPNVSPLATRTQRTISAHTGPGVAGLIFRSAERDAVAAALPAGAEDFVLLRSDLAELDLSAEGRAALRARHLREAG